MSNRIALTSLCLFIGLAVFAQNGSKWKIGVKGGVNYTDQLASNFPSSSSVNLNKLYNQSTEWLLGMHIGGSSSLQLTEKLALNADLLYNQRGFINEIVDTLSSKLKYTSRLHYLSLPLYSSWQLSPKLEFEIGAEAGYLLGVSGRVNGEKVKAIEKGSFNDLDFGLIGGLSFQLHQRLKVQGRYFWGLQDSYDITFTDSNGNDLEYQPKFNNHGVQFSLTVFPF